jgi:hypothetical protein
MFPNAEELDLHSERFYDIYEVSIQEMNLNKLIINFKAESEGGDLRWRYTFFEGETRTLSPNCPFTLNKVNADFVFYREYDVGVSSGRGSSPSNSPLVFEVINEPISDFCN